MKKTLLTICCVAVICCGLFGQGKEYVWNNAADPPTFFIPPSNPITHAPGNLRSAKDSSKFLTTMKHWCCCMGGCMGLRYKPIISFDTRQSYTNGQLVKVNGLRFGLELHEKYRVRVGFGTYKGDVPILLEDQLLRQKATIPTSDSTFTDTVLLDTIKASVNFQYNTLFFEYVFYEDYKWEFSAPLALGLGKGNVRIRTASGSYDTSFTVKNIPVLSLSVFGQYNIFPWIGVGAGFGYRQVITTNKDVNKVFSAPFYAIKVKLILGPVIKYLFKKEEFLQEKQEYHDLKEQRRRARQERRADKTASLYSLSR